MKKRLTTKRADGREINVTVPANEQPTEAAVVRNTLDGFGFVPATRAHDLNGLRIEHALDLGATRVTWEDEDGYDEAVSWRVIQFNAERRAVVWEAEFSYGTPADIVIAAVKTAIAS